MRVKICAAAARVRLRKTNVLTPLHTIVFNFKTFHLESREKNSVFCRRVDPLQLPSGVLIDMN